MSLPGTGPQGFASANRFSKPLSVDFIFFLSKTAASSIGSRRSQLGKVPSSFPHAKGRNQVRLRALMSVRMASGKNRASGKQEAVSGEALSVLEQAEALPMLVVFDLDYTLWPFWCECTSKSSTPHLYPQAPEVIEALKRKEVPMAVASRTPTPDIARAFLKKLALDSTFVQMEIYPSSSHKTEHFQRIHQQTGIPFSSMLFFDDEDRNIIAISRLGVTCVLVDNGINIDALKVGMAAFVKAAKSSKQRE